MKKTLLILLFATILNAQAQLNYALTHSNATYTELSSGTDVSSAAWSSNFTMAMPFQFKYFGNTYNNVYITFDGCYFSDTGDDYVFYGTDNYMPLNAVPTESPISYQLTGSSPNRIFKMQWKNIKESTVDTSSFEYTLNNQIWLYENGYKIEYRFGPNVITDPFFTEHFIGIIDYDNSPYLAIDSSAANPVLVRVFSAGVFNGIPTYPVNGQVYTLTPQTSSVSGFVAKPYRFISGNNAFEIRSEANFNVSLYDMNGRNCSNPGLEEDSTGKFKLNGFAPGIYLVYIQFDKHFFTEKILVR